MLEQELKEVVDRLKSKNFRGEVIKNCLKERLQLIVLDFIYSSGYRDLIFTGGSCLRFCHKLNRLSEDLDLDAVKKTDKQKLVKELSEYFGKKLKYQNLEASISGRGEKIYLKFPLLEKLGLSNRGESNKLYLKVEIETVNFKKFKTENVPIIQDGFSFFVKKYDLPSLMSGKIAALLARSFKKGKGDKITFKGRDYYDLIWYLDKAVIPNFPYLKEMTGLSGLEEVFKALDGKVRKVNKTYLKQDIEPLFESKSFASDFAKNFKDLYREKSKIIIQTKTAPERTL